MRTRTIALTAGALGFGLTSAATTADHDIDDDREIPFAVAEVFFELNNTDGDLGIHSSVDGEPWKKLEMEGPNGRELLEIDVRSRLRRQGLTQLFYESAEPTFDELDPDKFFRRFPPGEYEIGLVLVGCRQRLGRGIPIKQPAVRVNVRVVRKGAELEGSLQRERASFCNAVQHIQSPFLLVFGFSASVPL